MKERGRGFFRIFFAGLLLAAGVFPLQGKGFCEGSKELNSNNAQSTQLYLCNDFTNHCSSSAGIRSQFATYDASNSAGDVDRLYFVTTDANEVVYLGFKGGSLTNPARHIVYRIKSYPSNAIVQAEQTLPSSGNGYISAFSNAWNGPNQLILTPPYNGYDALVFTPPSPGTYYIEFSQKTDAGNAFSTGSFYLTLFDITVGNTVTHLAKPGRLYSKCWQFYETANFYGTNYVISDDSIVTSAVFAGMSGGHWNQYCNQSGCGNSSSNWMVSRMSLYEQQALYPQYKIFLNIPDAAVFPAASTPGQFIPPMPYGVQNCVTGHILFHIKVNKPGNVELTLTFPSPYLARTLNQTVVAGENLFDWDGLDGTTPTGVPVPNNTPVQFTVTYIAGLTNLPLYDVEGNSSGFTIGMVSPAGAAPSVFWDDTNIPGGTTNAAGSGCTSPPGCHSWANSGGSGFGDLNTVNTWWYNVSTSTAPVTIYEFRGPQALTFNQEPPQVFCANSGSHVFSVDPDVNTDVYHWSYTPSTGVTIAQATPGSYTVTVTFGATAASGTLKVYGSNTNCSMNGPESSMPVTINPLPVPTLTGPGTACTGQTGVTYTTESGKVAYSWTVSTGGTITSGGTSLSNTVTVTWNTAGAQSVSVIYQNPTTFCQAAIPGNVSVTVSPRPVPSLLGSTLACVGSSGVSYSTDPGKNSYVWQVSAGGTITSGTGTSSINVTWNNTGAQWVSVSYTDPVTGCTPVSPMQLGVTVSTLPNPTFVSGSGTACVGVGGYQYTTQPGMSNYVWIVSGGTITGGGGSLTSYATVTWNLTGPHSISVNYIFPSSTCTGLSPAVMNVMVHPLPVPSFLSGDNEACVDDPGHVYTTQPGMTNYTWTITGGIITSGGTPADPSATVTWTSSGLQYIRAGYTDPATGCTSAVPAVFPVTVHSRPQPSFVSGDIAACLNDPGHVYVTQPGKSGYTWSITGGSITHGGGATDDSVTVTWTSATPGSISVGYTDPLTQCVSASPALLNVTVNPLPVPGFQSGVSPVCLHAPGNEYTIQPGMTAYTWSVSGGSITSGGTSSENTIEVTWNATGNQSVSVACTDPATGCRSASTGIYAVWVNALPVPVLSGPAQACLNSSGNVYYTEPGMTGYQWTITGGAISPDADPSRIRVTWTSSGLQSLSVTFTDLHGCQPASATLKTVQVNALPAPMITGPSPVCTGLTSVYTTAGGMSGYAWTITPGGTLNGGGTSSDSSLTVTWNEAATQHVTVNYSLGTGCSAMAPTDYPVTVNPTIAPVIQQSPAGEVCLQSSAIYSTQPGMVNYTWTVAPGGHVLSATNTHEITVKWDSAGARWVRVNFTTWPDQCRAPVQGNLFVTVNPLPEVTITAGAGLLCDAQTKQFSVPAGPGSGFQWSVMPAALGSVASGQGSGQASIAWQSYGQGQVRVTGTDTLTGCTASSSADVTVNPKPEVSLIPCFDAVTTPGARKIILRGAVPVDAGKGVFSGSRVAFDPVTGFYQFDPDGASPGSYPIDYTYTNTYGCPASPPPVLITVQSNPFTCGGILTDVRDGRLYGTTLIGGKCWMTRNLDYGGTTAGSLPSTDNCVIEKYCRATDGSCSAWGGLYQWDEMMQYGFTVSGQGICPPEWHVPTESEWSALLAGLNSGVTPPDGIAGSFLKDLTRPGGFYSLQEGLLYFNQVWSFLSGYQQASMYWTSSPADSKRAVARGMTGITFSTSRYSSSRANAFSVRCVKD